MREMGGISKVVTTIILLAMVIAGTSAVWYVFSSNLATFGSANLFINVRGSYNGAYTILEIAIKNSGGRVAVIQSVIVDDTIDITADLGVANYNLAPGSTIQKVIVRSDIGPGNHVIKIVYEDHGEVKETYAEFSI